MNKTNIGWTDYTWNPVSGCSPIMEGCERGHAEHFAEMKRGIRAPLRRRTRGRS